MRKRGHTSYKTENENERTREGTLLSSYKTENETENERTRETENETREGEFLMDRTLFLIEKTRARFL